LLNRPFLNASAHCPNEVPFRQIAQPSGQFVYFINVDSNERELRQRRLPKQRFQRLYV
jgi:hypothetical protein